MCRLSLSHTAKRQNGTRQTLKQTCKPQTYAHAHTNTPPPATNVMLHTYRKSWRPCMHLIGYIYGRTFWSGAGWWYHAHIIDASKHLLYRHLYSSSHWYSLCEMICLSQCIRSHIISITMLIYNIWHKVIPQADRCVSIWTPRHTKKPYSYFMFRH